MHRNFNDYELIYSVRDKDEFAFDLIIDKYMPIILSETKKYYPFVKKCGEEFDDLVQIGRIALNDSIIKFDDNMNVSFYTFATTNIRYKMLSFCAKICGKKNFILNNSLSLDSVYFNKIVNDSYSNFDFIEIKNELDMDSSLVFELYYNGYSYNEISILLDYNISKIYNIAFKYRKILHKYINI